jgi:GT2 family glycosyltransferase
MNNSEFDLSIVIISWKMRDLLSTCLSSIFKFTEGLSFEVILIDNKSQDGTIEMVEKNFPKVRLIKNPKNRGVAPARNQGLKVAKGKYVLILDADMELVENSFLQLFQFMEEHIDCGLVGAKLVDSNGNLQYSCKRFPSLLSSLYRRLENFSFTKNSKILNYHMMKDWEHNSVREVDYLIGACQFFRRKIIDSVGFYDDKIFYGPEDIDYCIRVWKAGWKVIYYPLTKIIHHEQRITKKNPLSIISIKHIIGIFYIFKKYRGHLKY